MIDLIKCFFKVGVLAFGGGSAAAPLIKREAVEKHGWITEDEFIEIVAIANSLPGPSMSQMAGAIGYKRKGILGAIIASTSIIMPMAILFTIIMAALLKFVEVETLIKVVKPVFVIIAVMMLVLSKDLIKKGLRDKISPLMFVLVSGPIAVILMLTNLHPSLFIVLMVILVLIFVKENKK